MGLKIPWYDRQEWSQIVAAIPAAVESIGNDVESLREIARQIEGGYADLDGLLDGLGAITCCSCTKICCTVATVWYDVKDLLFLYLADSQLPEQQISRNADRRCGHLTPHGCSLARRKRPFICTWYICSTQKDALLRQKNGLGEEIFACISRLKARRKELENRFSAAVGEEPLRLSP